MRNHFMTRRTKLSRRAQAFADCLLPEVRQTTLDSMYNSEHALLTKNSSFPTATPVVVIDPRFLPELRNLPDDVLDFAGAIDDVSYSSCARI